MKTKHISEREYRRAGQRFYGETRLKLQKQLEMFFDDTVGKTDAEVLDLYNWYEKKWQEFAGRENKVKIFTVYGDAFESACKSSHANFKKLDPSTVPFDLANAIRVAELLRDRTRWEKFVAWIKGKPTTKPQMRIA